MLPRTREELIRENRLHSSPYSYYDKVMSAIFKDKDIPKLFHSDVYYVRAALEKRTGLVFSLPMVEKVMREEGWSKK